MKCPQCGCENFYVKDPDDEYEEYEFTCKDGQVVFDGDGPEIDDSTEAFCNKCAWHGKIDK